MPTDTERLTALEAEVARLRAEVARLQAEPRAVHWYSYPPLVTPVPVTLRPLTGQPTYGLRIDGAIPEPPLVPVWGRSTAGAGS